MNLISLTAAMGEAAKRAGQLILSIPRPTVTAKDGHANFVTTADVASQELLLRELSALLPEAHFFTEEEKEHTLLPGWNWIIDPIDGTTNFIRQNHASAVSIGLCKDGEVIAGVVYDFYADELFAASKGNGATLNGTPIHTAHRPVEESLIALGTSPYYRDLLGVTMDTAKALFAAGGDLRRSGSAALDLCAVACGRYDAFFEATLSPWDYAASTIILQEAGGEIGSLPKEAFALDHNVPIFAADAPIYQKLYAVALDNFLKV